jgi:hypothetical protein
MPGIGRVATPIVGVESKPKPSVYTFRLSQYQVKGTRSLHDDSNIVGYTLNVGQQSYTQTLPPSDVNNGYHGIGLEFPGLGISDPTTIVTLAFAIVNAGHNASAVEAAFQKGVDSLIASPSKSSGGGGTAGSAGTAAAAGAAVAVGAGATFGTALIVAGAMIAVDAGLSLLFANCDGSVAADKIAPPRSAIDALIPANGCVATHTAHYPGTGSSDGCGSNSDYYVTQTIIRTQVGAANEPEAGKLFIILGRASGLVLDIPGGARTAGLQIQQWQDNGTAAQHWELEPVGDGYFMIRSSLNGLVLQVDGNSGSDHAQIQQAAATNSTNQHWMFEQVAVPPPDIELPVLTPPSPFYRIRSRSSGKVFDVPERSATPGIKIQQYTANTGDNSNQLWQFVQVPVIAETHPVAV